MKEFENWWKKNSGDFKRYPHSIATACFKEHEKDGWKAALRMIKSEGVISDYELAGKIIKDELEE